MIKNVIFNTLTNIREAIFSKNFREKHKLSANDFIRNRKLPFSLVLLLIFRGLKTTLKSDIEHMWENILVSKYGCKTKEMSHNQKKKYNARLRKKNAKQQVKNSVKPTKAAFVKARKKIKSSAFIELFHMTVKPFFELEPPKDIKWNYEIIAIDGSTSEIENTQKLRAHYGENTGSGKPLARFQISGAYNTLREIFIDVKMDKYNTSERDFVKGHIEAAIELGIPRNKLLFVLDRGYPSQALTNLFNKYKVKYVMRVNSSYTKLVNNANEKDQVIHYISEGKLVTERVINVTLKTGDNEKLLTNIMDIELPYEDFIDLYYERWDIEKAFDTIKNSLEIENYSAITPNSIEQDFYATLCMFNLLKLIKSHTDDEIEKSVKNRKLKHERYETNFNQLILKLRDTFIKLFLEESSKKRRRLLYDKIDEIICDSETKQPIRKNRKSPEAHGTKCGNKFPMNKRRVV